MTEALTEGWGVIRPGDRKAHYYRDTFSLCRTRGFYTYELEPDNAPSPADCAACRKVLDREKAPAVVKPPTVRLVSAVLRKARFPKGEHGGKVLDYAVTVSGFAVSDKSGSVTVAHWSRLHAGKDAAEEREALAAYSDALTAAGWEVETDQRSRVLRVHAPATKGEGK